MSRPIYPKPKSEIYKQHETPAKNKSSASSKQMSFEELHRKLQARLNSQGIINDLRAELRTKLMHELYEIADPVKGSKIVSSGTEESQLPLQISNWLVCDHFQRGNFEFTLSTFLRESGIVTLPEYNMTFFDVLYIFGIHPNTDFYKSICEKYKTEKSSGGLLFFIVQHLLMHILPQSLKTYAESSTETEDTLLFEDRLQKQVLHEIEYVRRKLDSEIRGALEGRMKNQAAGKELLCVSCQTDAQLATPTTLEHAKIEIGRLEKLFQSAEGDLKRQKQHLEQELLEKTREMEFRIMSQVKDQDRRLAQERLHQKTRGNETDDSTEGNLKFNLEKSQLKVKELESQLQLFKEQNNIVQKQNKSFLSMIESMADYEVLKSDLSVTRRELELSQSRYQEARHQWLTTKEELEKKVVQLTLQITSPCLELLSASQEVQKVMEKSQLEQNSWSQERNHWQKELQKAQQVHHREYSRVEEQKEHIENLHQVIHNLQLQLEKSHLRITEQGRNTNTMNNNPSVKTLFNYLPNNAVGTEISETLKNTLSDQKIRSRRPESLSPSANSKSDYIKEAKQRIDQLQAEADSLERKYSQCLKNQSVFATPCQPYKSIFSDLGSQEIYHFTNAQYLNTPQHYQSPLNSFNPHSYQRVKISTPKYDQSVFDKTVNNPLFYNLPSPFIPSTNYGLNTGNDLPQSNNSMLGNMIFESQGYTANNLTAFDPQDFDLKEDKANLHNNDSLQSVNPISSYKDSVASPERLKQSEEQNIGNKYQKMLSSEERDSQRVPLGSSTPKKAVSNSSSPRSSINNGITLQEIFGKPSLHNVELAAQNSRVLLIDSPEELSNCPKVQDLLESPGNEESIKVKKTMNLDESWKQVSGNSTERKFQVIDKTQDIIRFPPTEELTNNIKTVNLDEAWKQISGYKKQDTLLESQPQLELNLDEKLKKIGTSTILEPVFSEGIVEKVPPGSKTESFEMERLVEFYARNDSEFQQDSVHHLDNTAERSDINSSDEKVELTKDTQPNFTDTRGNIANHYLSDTADFNTDNHSTPVNAVIANNGTVEQNDVVDDESDTSDIILSIGDQAQPSDKSDSVSMW